MVYERALAALQSNAARATLKSLYPDPVAQAERVRRLAARHRELYSADSPLSLLSAPGRAEIIGNHTDHNHGMVLAAAVNLDTLALVSPRQDGLVRIYSEGYGSFSVSLDDLRPENAEPGTSSSLVMGVARGLRDRGFSIGGFDGVMDSQVLSGSGLSSSAAFEVAVCAVFDALYNGFSVEPVARAQISQYAENVFFGKPSGLMDQMASSFGGLVRIDFARAQPEVEALGFSFARAGYALVIVNTRSSHDDLTSAYSAIPAEMRAVASACGGTVLSDIGYGDFLKNLPLLYGRVSDRALLRAMHFFQENILVTRAADAIRANDLPAFFGAVNASGISSETQLQNIHVKEERQPLALALALARQMLQGEGACRVHGGGFAGTTLNFVPLAALEGFSGRMDAVFGPNSSHVLDVRERGAVRVF